MRDRMLPLFAEYIGAPKKRLNAAEIARKLECPPHRWSAREPSQLRLKTLHTTWKPHEKHGGDLTERSDLPDSMFAFPKQRKEPLTNASTYATQSRASPDGRRLGRGPRARFRQYQEGRRTLRHRHAREELEGARARGRTKEDRGASARKAAEARKEHERQHRK